MSSYEVRVRKAELEEIEALVTLDRACFAESWSVDSWNSVFSSASQMAYCAELDNQFSGFILVQKLPDSIEILKLAVEEKQRRKGVGEALVREIETKEAKLPLWLEVRESNTIAREFYEKMGFKKQGERKAYYRKPTEDALLLVKNKI